MHGDAITLVNLNQGGARSALRQSTAAVVAPPIKIQLAPKFYRLFEKSDLKIFYGGRNAAKSHSFARALIGMAFNRKLRVLCTREYQTSIRDSVHRLLKDVLWEVGLASYFEITDREIRCPSTGSLFIFKGLARDIAEIKSTEGIDICWIEEGQAVSADSLQTLIPTIRKSGSELWISYNPLAANDPVHVLALNPPPGAIVEKVGWEDNPWRTEKAERDRLHLLNTDPVAYEHVYGGSVLLISEAIVFRNRVVFEPFETPPNTPTFSIRFYHGLDFGFANDPLAFVRCFMSEDRTELFIDEECGGVGIEIDETPELMRTSIPTSKQWPIKADNARPESISYLRRHGPFSIEPATKWAGSVEDGIAFLKGFKKIHCHSRCKNTAQEFRLYSYKTDKKTGDVLPIIIDKHNHYIDAIRYALDGEITSGSSVASWLRL